MESGMTRNGITNAATPRNISAPGKLKIRSGGMIVPANANFSPAFLRSFLVVRRPIWILYSVRNESLRSIDSDLTLSHPVERESPQLSGSFTIDLAASACSELIAPLAFFAPRTAMEPYENMRNSARSMVTRCRVGLCPYRCL